MCVALYLSLSLFLTYTPIWGLDRGSWLCVFLFVWSFGGLEASLCVWMRVVLWLCCPRLSWTTFEVCVCCICLCVAEQQDPGCHSAEQWQLWWSCAARQCCCKQREDLEERVSAISDKTSHYISFCIVHLCQGHHFERKYPRSGCTWNFSSQMFLLSSFLKFSGICQSFFCLTHICLSSLLPSYWRAHRHTD